jgi:peptidoglycan/LPS O-acetylase OafA/YrhL
VTPELANIVGFVGMTLIIAAYAYVTASKAPNPFLLHGANLTGATLLVLSLLVNTNLPALVLESIWAAIALFGLSKAAMSQRVQP